MLLAARSLPKIAGSFSCLDVLSMALNGAAFALLVIGAEFFAKSPQTGLLMIAGAAIAIAVVVRREASRPGPLIPLDLLRSRSFRLSVIASTFCFTGQAAAMVALPFISNMPLGRHRLWSASTCRHGR